jgi:hypothetical protein
MGNIDIGGGRNLACNKSKPGSYKGFTGYTRCFVFRYDRVKNGIRDLVGYLVGMAFRHGFGRKQKTPH